MQTVVSVIVSLLFAVTCVSATNAGHGHNRPWRRPRTANCVILSDKVKGIITLTQTSPNAPVNVRGQVTGLDQGLHGFHIHQYGDLSNGCGSTGGHFNPFRKDHGAFDDRNRHVGDLGNIIADRNGNAEIDLSDPQLKLCGPVTIMGRSIVIHGQEDDEGKGGNEGSKKTGNAGPRVGCCIIGLAEPR